MSNKSTSLTALNDQMWMHMKRATPDIKATITKIDLGIPLGERDLELALMCMHAVVGHVALAAAVRAEGEFPDA